MSSADLSRELRPLLSGRFDRSSISRYEAGKNIPRPEVLKALAKVLQIEPSVLLPEEVERTDVVSFSTIGDARARITLDVELPEDVAYDILKLVNQGREALRALEASAGERKHA